MQFVLCFGIEIQFGFIYLFQKMSFLFWLMIISSSGPTTGADIRQYREIPPPTRQTGELSDFIVALSRLLAAQGGKEEIHKNKTDLQRSREARQGFAPALGECEVTGFETRVREECEEISEIQCKKVNVTYYRNEIRSRCKTLFDQTCNITYTEVPKNKCSQIQRER